MMRAQVRPDCALRIAQNNIFFNSLNPLKNKDYFLLN